MAGNKQTQREYTAAEQNRMRSLIDRVYGAGTFNRVNYGQVHAMLDGLRNNTTGNVNARDQRTATSLFGLVDGNSA